MMYELYFSLDINYMYFLNSAALLWTMDATAFVLRILHFFCIWLLSVHIIMTYLMDIK